jgi:photosystem II stability/assembly factor-like uncharacterized protein
MKYHSLALTLVLSILFQASLLAQWESIGSGISVGQKVYFSLSVVDENNIWAVPTGNGATREYTRTTDGGLTWQEGSLPDIIGDYYPGNIFALDANTAWIIMINIPQQNHIRIFKTEDGGVSWEEQEGEFNEVGHCFAALHFFNAQEGVGFGSPGTEDPAIDSLQIFRTNDGGDHWNRIDPNDLPTPLAGEGVWVYSGNNSYEAKGDTIWFVTRASRVFRSTDRGISWSAFEVGISGNSGYPGLSSIAFENSLNGIAVTYQPNRAARTTDGGETWAVMAIPSSPRLGAIEYIEGTEDTYLIHGGFLYTSGSMLLTTNGGTTWQTVFNPPSMNCMQFISPTLGFGGRAVNPTNNTGLYKWTGDLSDSLPTSAGQVFLISDQLTLFPNPASDILSIECKEHLLGASTISVEIFSTDGRLIQMTEHFSPTKIEIPISHLPAGIYHVLLTTAAGERLRRKFLKE